MVPQSPEVAEITKYSLMNIFNFESARSIAGLWFVENRFLDIFHFSYLELMNATHEKYFSLIIKMLYIMFFYFGLSFFALQTFKKSDASTALKIFLITAILGWLFVRNNGNMDQQNHLFFNISMLSILLFFRASSSFKKYFWFERNNIILLIILVFVISDQNNFTNLKLSGDSLNYRNKNSMTLNKFLSISKSLNKDRLVIDNVTPYWEQALISQMSGSRIYYEDLIDSKIEFSTYHLAQYSLK